MPRRFLGTRLPPPSYERMREAVNRELERPKFDEFVESQDYKLQVIKRSVVNSSTGPVRLTAEHAVVLSQIVDAPQPAIMISTHYNDTEQAVIHDDKEGISRSIADIDFSKAEDFLQLETPIDARKDHNMMRLALSIPNRSFMSRILHRYPLNRKRLAFIQRRLVPFKASELGGTVVGGGGGGPGASSVAKAGGGGENKEAVTVSCMVCGMRFTRQHQFQRHILTHPDPDNKRFLCQICGKRFNRADHLNRHAVLHGDPHHVHKCLLCGEEFDRPSHLDRHRRKHHPPAGQPPSQTPPLTPQAKSPPLLGQGYLSPSSPPSAYVDVETVTSGSNLHLLASVATPEEETLLESVPESFIQTQIVAMENMDDAYPPDDQGPNHHHHHHHHHHNHQEQELEPDRPFVCDMCGRKFIRATHLRRHIRIHTGEKPFACHICGRRYARGDYLRAHIQAHRRDKIHKCKHCGDMFQDLTRFADHCRIVHRDEDDEYGNPCPPPPDTPPAAHQVCVAEDPLELEGAEISLVTSNSPLPITTYVTGEQGVELVANMLSSPSPSSHPHHHNSNLPLLTPLQQEYLQLSHLEGTDLHNGIVPDTGNEVVILSHPKVSQYMEHYIINNSGLSP